MKQGPEEELPDINGSKMWPFYNMVKDFGFIDGRDRHFKYEAQRGAGQRP